MLSSINCLCSVAVNVLSRIYFILLHRIFSILASFQQKKHVAPSSTNLLNMSATSAAVMIKRREITSLELINVHILRIEQINPIINAIVIDNFSDARKKAEAVDQYITSIDDDTLSKLFEEKPLYGIPFTTKDAIEVEGKNISCGLYYRKDTVCRRNAKVIERMEKAGGILLAITNVPEGCLWIESNNAIYGKTNNPYDTRRTCGGSSGGEGALISAQGSMIGIGSDIGGSIRVPSFCNGIFGMKTTPEIIPLNGHVPEPSGYLAKMLRIGPICRYAADIPLLVKVMGGQEASNLGLDEPVSMNKLRVYYMEGISSDPRIQPLSYEMRAAIRQAVDHFENKYDILVHKLDLPLVNWAMDYFHACMERSEDQPQLGEYLLDSEGKKGKLNVCKEIPKYLLRKSNHSAALLVSTILDELPALSADKKNELIYKRDRLGREIQELLGDDGILLFPSWPCTAPFHYEPILSRYNVAYTALFNCLALPVVQCPMGLDKNGIPLGVQVIGSPYSDRLLISVAQELEEGFGGWQPANSKLKL